MLEYQRSWLRLDVIAGLTAAAVIVPKAMAYATSPVAGADRPLHSTTVADLRTLEVHALSVSSTTTIAILLAAQLDPPQPPHKISATATLPQWSASSCLLRRCFAVVSSRTLYPSRC
jgi:hypothetical protein